jgi:hypothetical protein
VTGVGIGFEHECFSQAAKEERARVVAFGRAYVERKIDSSFSTSHLTLFLDAVERGEHVPTSRGEKE